MKTPRWTREALVAGAAFKHLVGGISVAAAPGTEATARILKSALGLQPLPRVSEIY